jgi:hypothetical protein
MLKQCGTPIRQTAEQLLIQSHRFTLHQIFSVFSQDLQTAIWQIPKWLNEPTNTSQFRICVHSISVSRRRGICPLLPGAQACLAREEEVELAEDHCRVRPLQMFVPKRHFQGQRLRELRLPLAIQQALLSPIGCSRRPFHC